MPTLEQDAWLADTFQIDLTRYTAKSGKAGEPAGDLSKQLGDIKKLAAVWKAAESKIHKDVGGLLDKLRDVYEGDAAAPDMEKDFQVHFDKIAGKFDGTLATALSEAAAVKSAEELTKVKAELRAAIGTYEDFVENDEVVALMDENPFVTIDVAGVCRSTLRQMLTYLD